MFYTMEKEDLKIQFPPHPDEYNYPELLEVKRAATYNPFAFASCFYYFLQPDVNQAIESWTNGSIPTCYIATGDNYGSYPYYYTRDEIFPKAELHIFEYDGHFVHWTKSAEINQIIAEFIDYN